MPIRALSLGRLLSVGLFAVASSAVMPGAAITAENCLQSPDRQAPSGSRWYYRTDPATQRQCWHLKQSEADTSAARLPNRNHRGSAGKELASAKVQTGTKSSWNATKAAGDKPEPSTAVPADDEATFQKFSEWWEQHGSTADACLPSPNGPADPGAHWRYRVDPVNQRHCWYQKRAGLNAGKPPKAPAGQARAEAGSEEPASMLPLTAAERETLFQEFLQWQKERLFP